MAGKFASVAANTASKVDETIRQAAQRENNKYPAPKAYRFDHQTLAELESLRDSYTESIGAGKRPSAATVLRYLIHKAAKKAV
jgi:hypothetical protein